MSKTIEEAAKKNASCVEIFRDKETMRRTDFIRGANFALASQWRSVEDGLPEDGDVVLAKIEETADEHEFIRYTIARYEDGCWIFQDDYFEDCTVTHFMYIPSLNPEQR